MRKISSPRDRIAPIYQNAKYSFDTSAFIEPWRRHYPRDVFKGLWNHIERLLQNNIIIASYMVKEELARQHDDLFKFVSQFDCFVEPLPSEQEIVKKLVNHSKFDKWGETRFHEADPFVVALAKEHDLTVVTYESPHKTKNSIPVACDLLDIEAIKPPELFRRENIIWRIR